MITGLLHYRCLTLVYNERLKRISQLNIAIKHDESSIRKRLLKSIKHYLELNRLSNSLRGRKLLLSTLDCWIRKTRDKIHRDIVKRLIPAILFDDLRLKRLTFGTWRSFLIELKLQQSKVINLNANRDLNIKQSIFNQFKQLVNISKVKKTLAIIALNYRESKLAVTYVKRWHYEYTSVQRRKIIEAKV